MTRILQASLGGNSKTSIICTITQTLSNYQETVNTLHFGQKAKHVKTKVNVNEINQLNTSANSSVELERANSMIAALNDRLKLYEGQMLAPAIPLSRKQSAIVEGAASSSMEESKE